jgi:hypothetical protein
MIRKAAFLFCLVWPIASQAQAQNFRSYSSNSHLRSAPPKGQAKQSKGENSGTSVTSATKLPARPPESAYYKHISPNDVAAAQEAKYTAKSAAANAKTKAKSKVAPATATYGPYTSTGNGTGGNATNSSPRRF